VIARVLLALVWLAATFVGGLFVVAGLELALSAGDERVLLGAVLFVVGLALVYGFGASLLDLLGRRFGP
jgi:nitric oxide reductase large subunit